MNGLAHVWNTQTSHASCWGHLITWALAELSTRRRWICTSGSELKQDVHAVSQSSRRLRAQSIVTLHLTMRMTYGGRRRRYLYENYGIQIWGRGGRSSSKSVTRDFQCVTSFTIYVPHVARDFFPRQVAACNEALTAEFAAKSIQATRGSCGSRLPSRFPESGG